jgi:hypothetical protein
LPQHPRFPAAALTLLSPPFQHLKADETPSSLSCLFHHLLHPCRRASSET